MTKMLALLADALRDPSTRKETVESFQSLFSDCQSRTMNPDAYEVLANLSNDLNYFQPDASARMSDPSYYGHERLRKGIRSALQQLADLGIEVPHDHPGGEK
jgi:hypothetical protein